MTTFIVELRILLDQVCDARQDDSMAAVMALEDSLNMKKERMINLLDDAPQNAEHRTLLKSGKPVINGKEFRVNEDFIKQAIFLSDQLNLDEYEAARLLLEGISESSNVNSTPLDTAVYMYHSERGHVLAILNVLLEAIKDSSFNTNVRGVFSNFIGGIVSEKPANGSFVERVVKSTRDLSVKISEITKLGMLESAHDIYKRQKQLEDLHHQHHNQPFSEVKHFPSELLHLLPETTKLRIDRLNEERISLAQILYHIASLHWLPENDLVVMLTKVQSINLADGIAPYILTAFLAAISFDCSYPSGRQGIEFSANDAFLKKMHDQITGNNWRVNTLKTVVQIQWALFINIISHSRPSVDKELSFDKEQRLRLVKSAIALDAFGFMNNYLLYFKQEKPEDEKKKIETDDVDMDTAMILDGLIVDPDDYTKFDVFISKDFQIFVVHEMEYLTQSFILNMSEIFQAIKSDVVDREISAEKKEEINNSLTKFLTLLASIYRDRMDAGLKFWNSTNNALYRFLGFLVDYRLPQSLAATFDFFGAISTGIESATNSHTMLKIGTNKQDISNSNLFSWGKLFATIQFFTNLIRENSADGQPPAFPPEEEDSLCKFLYLCQQVVQYSVEARLEIWSDPLLRAHESIVLMISCQTSHRLRASLYNLLTAFCSNWGGGINDVGRDIALEVWKTLEHSDMIIPDKVMVTKPTKVVATSSNNSQAPQNTLFKWYNAEQPKIPTVVDTPKPSHQLYLPEKPPGILREFEEGKTMKSYTETLAVLKLVSSLIHTPSKRDKLIAGFSSISTSIPNLLGSDNNRSPGTAPYISLVVDHIFLNIKNLKFSHPDVRWQLTESCLTIVENSLMAFDIEPLTDYIKYNTPANEISHMNFLSALKGINAESDKSYTSHIRSALLAFITLPGYDILLRILSGGALIHEIFKIVELGKDAVTKTKNEKNDYFTRSMTRCLRIFSRVFKIQNAFVNVFMPQLNILVEAQPGGVFKLDQYTFPIPPPSYRSLGSLMMYNTKVIVQIALMVNCDAFETLCNLSAATLANLASQPDDNFDKFTFPNHINVPMGGIGSKLAGILASSPDASSIVLGFSERLQIENSEILTYDDYEYDMNIIPFWLAEKTLGNIYRFDNFDDNDQHSPSIRITILDMLLNNMAKEIQSPTISEFLLGYDVKELETSGTQHKSLPTDVKHKSQLACLLSILELVNTGINNDVDDVEEPLIRTHPVLAEKCYQLIFELCVRQSTSNATLHYLRNNTDKFLVNQFKAIACRLESCVSVSEHYFIGELESADKTIITADYFTLVSILNQRAWLLKLVALDLLKTDSNKTGTLDLLELLYGIEESQSHGNSEKQLIRNMEKMQLKLDANYQQPLWNMLEIVNSLEFTWTDGLDEGPLPPTVYFKNFHPDKYVIQKDGYTIYDIRNIFKIIRQYQLKDPVCQNLSDVERNAMELEMGSLLKYLMAQNRYNEISFARLHCLRAWKQVVEVTIADCFDLLTFEARQKVIYDLLSVLLPKLENGASLHLEILKGLGEVTLSLLTRLREDKRKHSILQVGSDASVSRLPDEKLRSVFNSIINTILRDSTAIEVRSAMYSALVNLIQYITPDKDLDDASPNVIHNQVINIIGGGYKEQLFDIICNDASQGLDIYKTSAYKALEALYVLTKKSKSTVIHSYFLKKNFLKYNIAMIERSDLELVKIINERDGNIHIIYMYIHFL
ncbi:nucleoporin Nup186/Nup192/Nup205 [Mucor mucedo]|uniref:nucleoporin Nup186/Nup192/Nup205 n=1 Tax=Mucor mucedo TaxID=29922 RepID=UPI00222124FB|nr:nucleoporin Nup186/Nup192/Nup205 [Mucor mucedo]KAI7887726.1 nucleoporin Nup186/Nup192/Nup205 [Mucor mucedo]